MGERRLFRAGNPAQPPRATGPRPRREISLIRCLASLKCNFDMSSENPNSLGTDDGGKSPIDPRRPQILGRRAVWIFTLVGAYLISSLWLRGFVICVPYVIMEAPLGLTSLFQRPATLAQVRVSLGPTELLLHLLFWSLFITGLVGCERLDRRILRTIFAAVVVLIVLTMRGCAIYYSAAGTTFN
jgi:hypothetical protein